MKNTRGKKPGFPVLAYHSKNSTSLWHGSLLFKHSAKSNQATFCLRLISINGFVDEEPIIFQIDANNLNCHNSSLSSADINLTQEQLKHIQRRTDISHDIRTLTLSLRKTCQFWCLKSKKVTAPAPIRQLAEFAKATQVQIVFDYTWLHKDSQVPFLISLLRSKGNLTGFPVADLYPEHRLADWKIFEAADTAGPLPSYADVTNKRPRAASTPAPSPPPKRITLDLSPTVSASSIDDLSTEPPPYNPKKWDFQTSAIERAVKKYLSSTLVDLFTLPPTPDLPVPLSSQFTQPTPRLNDALRRLLIVLQPTLTTVYDRAISEASEAMNIIDGKFYDSWESQMLDLLATKDEYLKEMEEKLVSLLEEFKVILAERERDFAELLEKMAEESLRDAQKQFRMLEQFKLSRSVEKVAGKGREIGLNGNWRENRRRGKGGYHNLGTRWKDILR